MQKHKKKSNVCILSKGVAYIWGMGDRETHLRPSFIEGTSLQKFLIPPTCLTGGGTPSPLMKDLGPVAPALFWRNERQVPLYQGLHQEQVPLYQRLYQG